MSVFNAGNPVMREQLFGDGTWAAQSSRASTMTVNGAVTASLILTAICGAGAVASYGFIQHNLEALMPMFFGSMIGGLVLCLVMSFKPASAPYVGVPYAAVEGVFVGAVSLVYAKQFAGTKIGGATGELILLNAGLLTIGTLAAMLTLYRLRIIQATEKFKAVMLCAIGGVCLFSLVVMVARLFGVSMPWLWDGGPISILISVAILLVAAFKLILDFDLIESGSRAGLPKYMEWFAGVGLLITLVWLYLEFLRLLAILNRRD